MVDRPNASRKHIDHRPSDRVRYLTLGLEEPVSWCLRGSHGVPGNARRRTVGARDQSGGSMRTSVIRPIRLWLFRNGLVSCALLVLSGSAAFSEPGPETAPFRVQVKVDGDQGLRTQVTRCLTHALGDITDVLVTDERPNFKFRIIAMAVVTESRKNVGLSL